MTSRRLAFFVAALALSLPMFGADVRRGDVFRTADFTIICPTPPIGALYAPNLEWKTYLPTGPAVAFDSIGNLTTIESGALITFDSMLQQTRRVPLMETANSLAVDAAGF